MKKTFRYTLDEVSTVAKELIAIAGNVKTWTFEGDLGAGKTTLIKELSKALGSEDEVTSPTYTIVNEYHYPKGAIYHIDAYRIKSDEEAFDIGIEDILDSGEYVWIEWPQMIENFLTEKKVAIKIEQAEEGRILEIEILP